MNINKEFILKNLITICCIAAVLLLLLPFCSVTGSVSSAFIGEASDSETLTGFDMILGDAASFFGWFLIICPAVLVAMNYIEALKKYKSILAIVLPIVSIIAQIIVISSAKKTVSAAMGGSDTVSGFGTSISVKLSPGIGFYFLIVAYIATFIAGAMTYHGLTLDKNGIAEFGNKIKDTGKSGFESAKEIGEKLAQKGGEAVNAAKERTAAAPEAAPTEQPASAPAAAPAPAPAPAQNISTADTLALLENLAKMKENGILTEEEFTAKKQELLKNI